MTGFHFFHRMTECVFCLLMEKDPSLFVNRLQSTSCSISNHRCSTSLGFQGCDSEIIFTWKDKGPGFLIQAKYLIVITFTKETNRLSGNRSAIGFILTSAHDLQVQF